MKILFIILLLFNTVCFAEVNEKYSFKDFTDIDLSTYDSNEFNGKGDIVGSCFYQEYRDGDSDVMKNIFPKNTENIIFTRCNLDNVNLPKGSKLIDCTNKRIKTQNDLMKWELDENSKPISPINKDSYIIKGRSMLPKDIPDEKNDVLFIFNKEIK